MLGGQRRNAADSDVLIVRSDYKVDADSPLRADYGPVVFAFRLPVTDVGTFVPDDVSVWNDLVENFQQSFQHLFLQLRTLIGRKPFLHEMPFSTEHLPRSDVFDIGRRGFDAFDVRSSGSVEELLKFRRVDLAFPVHGNQNFLIPGRFVFDTNPVRPSVNGQLVDVVNVSQIETCGEFVLVEAVALNSEVKFQQPLVTSQRVHEPAKPLVVAGDFDGR